MATFGRALLKMRRVSPALLSLVAHLSFASGSEAAEALTVLTKRVQQTNPTLSSLLSSIFISC